LLKRLILVRKNENITTSFAGKQKREKLRVSEEKETKKQHTGNANDSRTENLPECNC